MTEASVKKRIHDPVKDHAYYEAHKKLKGHHKSGHGKAPPTPHHAKGQETHQRVIRLKQNISKLKGALSEAEAALSSKRQKATKKKGESSDGKTTVKQRQSSKAYRDKHKTALKAKRKDSSSNSSTGSSTSAGFTRKSQGSSSSGSSSKTSSKSVNDMGTHELRARISKIKSALRDARRQLSNASQELGQLTHSAILSEPNVNDNFARFQSAERIPSK